VTDELMRMEQWWNDTYRGKPNYSGWKPIDTKKTKATTTTIVMNWI
jgi:hypothetical protein